MTPTAGLDHCGPGSVVHNRVVVVSITVTVPSSILATYTCRPSGLTATPFGVLPTGIATGVSVLEVASRVDHLQHADDIVGTVDSAQLAKTDIADHALSALRTSAIREVVVLGRRGHLQAAFNNPELDELTELANVELLVDLEDLPSDHEVVLDEADWTTLRKLETLRRYTARPPKGRSKRIVLRFLIAVRKLLTDVQRERD
jgi:hypothetical protein